MGLSYKNQNIRVIARVDDALDSSCLEPQGEKPSKYEEYLLTLDEKLLTFVEGMQPTRFVLKKTLGWEDQTNLKDEQIKVHRDDKTEKVDVDVKVGSTAMRYVNAALVGIEHPEGADPGDLVYDEKAGAIAKKELVAIMESIGVVNDLYTAAQNFMPRGASKKKK